MLRSRLAPTPSGYLHLGNAFSFLLTWLLVRKENGELLLRIDDLDAERKRPEYVQDIFDSLEWLQLNCDKGPRSAENFEEKWSQQLRLKKYHATISQLGLQANAIFACSCSRAQLQQLAPGTNCACAEKKLPRDTPGTALRFFVPGNTVVTFGDEILGNVAVNLSQETGSFVIRRRDGIPAYQIASLADDLFFGINFIVRGQDLLSSTAAQLQLAKKLGAVSFLQTKFVHHPLLSDEQGKKLSKSEGALALKTLRENGTTASEVYKRFAQAIGMHGILPGKMDELQDAFSSYALKKMDVNKFSR